MKIIRQGEYHGTETMPHRFECKRCGCVWEAEPGGYNVATQYGGDCVVALDISCHCPTCDAICFPDE